MKNIALRNDELWVAAKERDFDAVYRLTFETLNWIINSVDWLRKNYSNYRKELSKITNGNSILLGLRQAYNSFKHNMAVISVEEKNYDLKITVGNNEIPIERIVWLPSIQLDDPGNYEDPFNAYCKYLEGKSILETLKEAEVVLRKVYSSYFKSA